MRHCVACRCSSHSLVCGTVLVFAIEFIDTRLHIDDPVGASSVHGVCGILGTLMTGLLAVDGGLMYSGDLSLLGAQCMGIICIDAWLPPQVA